MNSPPDRGRGSDDPLRYSPNWERNGGRAERPDATRWPLQPEAPARQIRDLAEESIRPSAVSPPGDGGRVANLPAPYIPAPHVLDLEVVREVPRRGRGPFGTFGRFALAASIPVVGVIAALLTFRTLPPGWTDLTGEPAAQTDSKEPRLIGQIQASAEPRTRGTEKQPSLPRPRLVVLRERGADEAIPLGLSLAGVSRDAALVLTGLPSGWTISTGLSLGADKWLLSASELSDATIRPSRGFVGAIDLAVELRLADDTAADRLSFRLTWGEAPKAAAAIAAAQTTAVAAPVETGSTSIPPRETSNSQATSAPLRRLGRDEIADLRKRGEEFLAAGNLGLARLVLQRAAEAGDPQAAFALATTYDPILLETRRVIGVVPDIATARAWYEKAKEFGSTDASLRLELFARRDR